MASAALDSLALKAQYEGGYWNTTGLSRPVIVSGLADSFNASGCEVFAHGCVGGGNDQRRFERHCASSLPGVPVLAPWTVAEIRESIPNRHAMDKYVADRGMSCLPGNTAQHSLDGNIAGFSHEDASLEDLSSFTDGLDRRMGTTPAQAPNAVRRIVVTVKEGRPIELDGQRLAATAMLEAANAAGGTSGLGLYDVLESRVNGTKCRGVYEAPGMEVLSAAVEAAYEASIDRPASRLRQILSTQLGDSIYDGSSTSVAARAARAGLEEMACFSNAVVALGLFKGSVIEKAVLSSDPRAGLIHQRRFAGNGHNWASAPLEVSHNS